MIEPPYPATITDEQTGVVIAIDPRTGMPGFNSLFLLAVKRAKMEEEERRGRSWWRRLLRVFS